MLAGVVLGGFLGELLEELSHAADWLDFLKWGNYGVSFGLTNPVSLDLSVFAVTFGFTIRFSVCGIFGMLLGAFIYRKL